MQAANATIFPERPQAIKHRIALSVTGLLCVRIGTAAQSHKGRHCSIDALTAANCQDSVRNDIKIP
jgi:hypothetical protein